MYTQGEIMKNVLFLTVASLLLTTTSVSAGWLAPSEEACVKGGGKYKKTPTGIQVCKANFTKTKNICRSQGAKLPKLTELERVVTMCGGKLGDRKYNIKNTSYHACLIEKGFYPHVNYWSSTKTTVIVEGSSFMTLKIGEGTVTSVKKFFSSSIRCN